ncbi:MAG: flagellar hook-length control protein FliK [Lachnospiraceae bacterium]|nr:flagellar hook-length control protein FliK [Lachnospiraceae bacterium]
MQITDLVNQYQANLSSGPDMTGKTKSKGTEQLTKTLATLQKGQIFEGTVNSIKGNQVILGLSSGQNITARLDKGVGLAVGESVFFQVKSNEESLIQIKPVSFGALNNPTILDALSAAGLPVTEDNVNMVNTMMKEHMPIDAKSISDMAHKAATMPGSDVSSIVTMMKNDLPVTREMVTQFENYKANEGQILKELTALSESISETVSGENVSETETAGFVKELNNILTGPDVVTEAPKGAGAPLQGAQELVADKNVTTQADSLRAIVERVLGADAQAVSQEASADTADTTVSTMTRGTQAEGLAQTVSAEGEIPTAASGETAEVHQQTGGDVSSAMANITRAMESGEAENVLAPSDGKVAIFAQHYDSSEFPVDSIGRALSPDANERLAQTISDRSDFARANPQFFDGSGAIRPEVSAREFFTAISDYFSKNPTGLKHITAEGGFSDLVSNLFEQKLSVEPQEIMKPHRLDDLYREMDRTMERVARAAESLTHTENNPIAQAASELHDNLDFISQVNHMYSYIQIPLKLSGQQATGDLYVYKNKKQSKEDDDTVSAFLHFDMEHLGSTDISVKMRDKKVDTKFFMEDDAAFDLIMNNIHILKEKLDNLGYDCQITVENDSHPVDFVSDFLERGVKVAENIQRYSFDVRA